MRAIKRVVLLLALLSVCGVVPFQGALAQKILERFNTPLPEIPLMEEQDFLAATTLYEDTPYNDEALAYKIRLPKNWQKLTEAGQGSFSLSSTILGEIARYYGPPTLTGRSFFKIQALELKFQTSAPEWFLQYTLSNGYTLEGMKIHNDKKVEALFVVNEGDASYSVRTIAHVNEKRMILAQYYVPYEFWEDEKAMQAQALGTFELVNLKDMLIEEMRTFQFLDVAEYKYPVSWELRTPGMKSMDRMNTILINKPKPDSMDGQIEIDLISHYIAEGLKEEIRAYKKKMEERGMLFGKMIEKKEGYDLDTLFDFALTEVYQVSDKDSALHNYEFWFTVMSAGEYYYFVSLLTPARDDDFFIWSRNTFTYELVLESMVPQENSLIND